MKRHVTNKLRWRALLVSASFVGALLTTLGPLSGLVVAATTAAKGSITVSPGFVNLMLPSGQQQASSKITLVNNYDSPIRLSAEWQAIDEATGRLIPSGPLAPELAKSLSISETDILIQPRASHDVTIVVHNSDALAPGGHYATLVFTELTSGTQKLGLQSALSVTVFIVKRDGARTGLTLNELSATHNLFRQPIRASISLTNSGNVHIVPRAAITIEHDGSVVAKGVANVASAPLLPGKKVTFAVNITQLQRVYWPARLQLRVVYRGDQGPEPQETVSSFWYIPPFWPLIMLAVIIGVFFVALKTTKILKAYGRRTSKPLPPTAVTSTTGKLVASQIDVSAVGVSPTHVVPVSQSSKSGKAAPKPRKITVISESAKSSHKNNK